VDAVVAGAADHDGLVSSFRHQLRPRWLWLSRCGEVGEFPDVVDVQLARLCAGLAPSGQESCDQILAADGARDRFAVAQAGVFVRPERDSSEPCYQRVPAVAFDFGLPAPAWSVRCLDGGLVTGRHLRHRGPVLAGQGLRQCGEHDPLHPVESPDVAGQQVVLDQAPVLGSERGHDLVIAVIDQPGPGLGFSPGKVRGRTWL